MKLDKDAIKEFAKREIQYNTSDPFEATLRGLETWMGKNNYRIVSFVEGTELERIAEAAYDCARRRFLQELPTQEDKGEALNPPE